WQVDDELNVVYFETAGGAPHAALLNFTAHPVVAMLLPQVSADYPGAAQVAVETALPGAVCLFTQGAAGNINASRVSTGFADVDEIGSRLGRAAVSVVEELQTRPPLDDPPVRVASETVPL